jgi:hypothetical protein
MEERIPKVIANVISVIFHPVFMPIYGLLIIFYTGTYFSLLPVVLKQLIFFTTIVVTFFLPLLTMPFLKFQKLISSYTLNDRQERPLPLFMTCICYGFSTYLFFRLTYIPFFVKQYMLASTVLILFSLLISMKWKISIHMAGIGGLTGMVTSLIPFYPNQIHLIFISLFIMAGFLGFARMQLNEHNPWQIYAGYFLGYITIFFIPLLYNLVF